MNTQGALLFLFFVASCTAQSPASREPKKVFCYFTNWAHNRPEPYNFNPDNVDPFVCDILIYAFADFGSGNNLVPSDKKYDLDDRAMVNVTMLKRRNKNLKVLMGTGNWKTGTLGFARITSTDTNRREFARNAVRYLRGYGFDGIDLNWQHPTVREGGTPDDKKNYVLLAQTLREEFEREASERNVETMMMTISIPHHERFLPGYDIPSFNTYMDYILVICYDYHFSYEDAANHHAPLYPTGADDEYNYDSKINTNYTINFFKELVEPRKLILGIPTFGRSYKLVDPDEHSLGSFADGPGDAGPYTGSKGFLSYFEICNNVRNENWIVEKPKPGVVGPYAHKGDQWVGYDDADMVKTKARYANDNGLGGVMFWTIDYDDFLGTCQDTRFSKFPLIRAAREELSTEETLEEMLSPGGSKTNEDDASRFMVKTPRPPRPGPNATKKKCTSGPPINKHGSDPCDSESPSAGIEPLATRSGTGTRGGPSAGGNVDVSVPQNMVGDLLTLIQRAGGLSSLCKVLREEKMKSNSRAPAWGVDQDDNSIILETMNMTPIMLVIQNSSIYIKELNIYTRP